MAKKLLVVDDNQGCSDLYKMRFEIDNWEVKTAFSAENAMEQLEKGDFKPDAILLDLMLPGMQGDEYLKVLKSDPKTKNIPVILLTALNLNTDDADETRKLADDIILKIDIMPQVLVEKVNKLVHQG